MKIRTAITKILSGTGFVAVALLTFGIWCISAIIRTVKGFARSLK
ncbi:hypothetical protein [Muribaculum intestinale]|nr:hypothetical protein [Muribaculum intestinale]